VIDRELVTRKIVLISGDLEELRKLDSAGLEAFLADPYKEILAERFLEREIEPEKVFEAIRSALADLPVYLQAVLSFIG
jgi:hypothetical protein